MSNALFLPVPPLPICRLAAILLTALALSSIAFRDEIMTPR